MNAPNKISILRIVLVPLFIGFLIYWNPERDLSRTAFAVFFLACLTDAVDGFLSRRLRQITRLGALIDPLADKLLLTSAYLGLGFLANIPEPFRLPPWLAILVVSRDAVLVAGAFLITALSGRFEPKTNFLGKLTTFAQMALVLLVFCAPGSRWIGPAVFATAALTSLSGFVYLGTGARLLGPLTRRPPSWVSRFRSLPVQFPLRICLSGGGPAGTSAKWAAGTPARPTCFAASDSEKAWPFFCWTPSKAVSRSGS